MRQKRKDKFIADLMHEVGFDPAEYEGICEIMRFACDHSEAINSRNSTAEDVDLDFEILRGHAVYIIAHVRDFHAGFYNDIHEIPEGIYCAMLGGADLLKHKWEAFSLQDAKDIVRQASLIDGEDQREIFESSEKPVKYYYMLETLNDLLVAHAKMSQAPQLVDREFLKQVSDVLVSVRKHEFPDSPLNTEIQSSIDPVDQVFRHSWARISGTEKSAKPAAP